MKSASSRDLPQHLKSMMIQKGSQPEATSWVPWFIVLSVIWGGSFALIKVEVDAGLAPMWVAFGRCFFGALALLAVCLAGRVALPRNRAIWGHAVVVAVLLNAVPFSLLAFGETRVSSVLAGVWNATTPLTTLLFIPILVPQERLAGKRLGLLVGFCGVLVVLGVWHGLGGANLKGSLLCLAAACSLGAGFGYTKRFFSVYDEPVAALSAAQLVCATVELGIAAPAISGAPTWPGWLAGICLLLLGTLGTGFAYILNLRVIRAAGPTIASTVTYVIPLWSTLLGTVLLGEPFSWNVGVGALLVISGVVLTRTQRVSPGRPSLR